jgi:HemY protein
VLAAKYESEAHQVRRAMKIVETAWLSQPHPDLADAYAHVRLGDSALNRLSRVEKLAAKVPGHIEGALALARAAIDAGDYARAREALVSFIETPTQRVAILMAELERAEHGEGGNARSWMLRAVRAALDPAWTADGYVSERWRPVSPVTGRLDAFQWLTPVAALPSEKAPVLDADIADEPALPAPLDVTPAVTLPAPVTSQDNEPAPAPAPVIPPAPAAPAIAPVTADVPPPVFRPRRDIEKPDAPRIPAVIPIVRAPDDPGVPDEVIHEEFDDPDRPEPAQQGGWKGFLSRLVS